jgi:ribose-phosphate pyrophosphokinase
MALQIVAGSATQDLGSSIARELGIDAVPVELERFPDGEARVRAPALEGDDVYVVQSTGPPVAENLVELLLLLDACRRAGAARLTAVVPYFGYARQDRRNAAGQSLGAAVAAQAMVAAGATRMVVVDPHTPAIEAIAGVPVAIVGAAETLCHGLSQLARPDIVVAPDLGAAKLARRYADRLGLPTAVVYKQRLTGAAVEVRDVVGDVRGARPLIVDDMISTGATIAAAVEAIVERGAVPDVSVVATHGLLVGPAPERLSELHLRQLVVSDSVAPRDAPGLRVVVRSIAPALAVAIKSLHRKPG